MNFLSGHDLSRYKDVLDKINDEYQKQEQLKKQIEEENNKIIALNLTRQQSSLKCKLFFVKLKIFNSVFDIYDLYDDEIDRCTFENLSQNKNCKFYLLEIYMQKSFHTKIVHQNWILNICIKNASACTYKSVPIKEKLSYPIYEVLPFEDSTENCTVEVCLLLPSDGHCTFLQLNKIDVDISYHFENYNRNSCVSSFPDKVFSLARCYNENRDEIKLLKTPPTTKYTFLCKSTKQDFAQACLKNSYHRLGVESFDDLVANEKADFLLKIATGENNKSIITFNKQQGTLKLQASINDVYRLKQFFINELSCDVIKVDKQILPQLINLNFYTHSDMLENATDVCKMKSIYEEIRSLFYRLPV